MRVEIIEGPAPAVRLTLNNGTTPDLYPCETLEQARIYASGLIDGARALRNESPSPSTYHYTKPGDCPACNGVGATLSKGRGTILCLACGTTGQAPKL